MSTKVVQTKCPAPGCGKDISVNVEVPDAIVKEVVREDTAKVNELSHQVIESKGALEALQGDLAKWQSGEFHLTPADMLTMLQTCPNCKPTMETFVKEQRDKSVSGLTVDQVKDLAKAHKFWPPPPIELLPGVGRKAR
jgi:hypothetical protein